MNTTDTDDAVAVTPARRMPEIAGIHHLKIPVSDLAASLVWYERVLGAVRVPEWDHLTPRGELFAYIVRIPGVAAPVELRAEPRMAQRLSGFDPVVFGARTLADLERWAGFLDEQGVAHSGVRRGMVGWLIVFRDPDGFSLRLYSEETHEFDIDDNDADSPWVAYP